MAGASDNQRGGASPVVFVPGFGPPSRSWEILRRHLAREGFVDAGVLTRPATTDVMSAAHELSRRVAHLIELSGTEYVHVVAHSVGGLVARAYVQLLGGDASTTSLVMVGTPHGGTRRLPHDVGPMASQARPGSPLIDQLAADRRPIDTYLVNYYTDDDLFLDRPGQAVLARPGARVVNIAAAGYAHLSVVFPGSLCRSISDQVAVAEGCRNAGRPLAALPGWPAGGSAGECAGDVASATRRQAIAASRAVHPSTFGLPAVERPKLVVLPAS